MAHFTQKPEPLLRREDFVSAVSARDNGLCVWCQKPGVDAHHLIDPVLFEAPEEKGGYFISNGVLLCNSCHLLAEQTLLSPAQLREKAGITNVVYPNQFEPETKYDKFGNPYVGAMRLKGELFFEENVQKILTQANVLGDFLDKVKYPRTMHLPWSENLKNDDRVIQSLKALEEAPEVVITEKLDGENSTLAKDYFHARSLDSKHHASRDWAKAFWGSIRHDIPKGMRLSCENLYARHSIAYDNLESYLYGFGIWTDRNECLSWDETLEWFDLFGITPAPTLYRGPWSREVADNLLQNRDLTQFEGFVVRVTSSYKLREHKTHCAKWVRKGHVQTSEHWMRGPVIPNKLKSS